MPFIVSAVPGIIIAILIALFMKEPARGGSARTTRRSSEKGTVLSLLKNPAYLCSILGYAAVTFSLGGISWWMPSFLQRIDGRTQILRRLPHGSHHRRQPASAAPSPAASSPRSGPKRTPKALYLVPALSALLAVPPALVCFFGPQVFGTKALTLPASPSPSSSSSSEPVPSTPPPSTPSVQRSAPPPSPGQLFLIHALGDAISPRIIGTVCDHSNLAVGLGSTLITLVIASGIFFLGARYAPPLQPSTQPR